MNGFGNQNKSKENVTNKVNASKEQIISQALHFHSKGNIDEAFKYYIYFINQGFKDHRVFTNCAIIQMSRGKYKEAEILVRQAIALKPNLVEGHFNLGCILTNLSKFKEAEFATRKAIELKPNHFQAHSNLGSILTNLGKLKEAELITRKAIELQPTFVDAHINLGEILIEQGKLNEGEQSLLKAIEVNPKNWKSYFHISKFYSREKKFREAFRLINSALKYDPKNHIVQGEFTRLKYILGKYDEGENYANNLWDDSDDYFYEDNNSDTLLISFGSMGTRTIDKNKIASFNFYRLFENDKSFDKLFIRDVKREFYLTGLKNSTKNISETINLIDELTSVKSYRKKVAIGSSAGGFAAILFGNLLNFSKVIAFNPQTVISEEKETVLNDFTTLDGLCKKLRVQNTSDTLYQKCLNLKNLMPFKTKVDLHFSNLSIVDRNFAKFIEHKNCKLIPYQSSSHLIAQQLKESEKLKSIIKENLAF